MKKACLFLIIGLFIVSCGKKNEWPAWKGTITEEDGVNVVHNPKEPMYLGNILTLEEEITIGVKDGPEEYMFAEISGTAIDKNDNIYVTDRGKNQVLVFDKNGRFLNSFGRAGQGPGEFGLLSRIHLVEQNKLLIEDIRRKAVHYFSLDGHYINSASSARMPMFGRTSLDSRGNIIGISTVNNPPLIFFQLKKFDSSMRPIHDIAQSPEFDPLKINVELWLFRFGINSKDEVVYVFPREYKIFICDSSGQKTMRIEKDCVPIKIPSKLKKDFYHSLVAFGKDINELSDYYPPIFALRIDDNDRIFIITYEKTENGLSQLCDVFDSQGRYVAKVPLPANLHQYKWKKGKLYGVYTDEDGYQYIKRYKVTWHY